MKLQNKLYLFAKKIHHGFLVKKMLLKNKSLFSNNPQKIIGQNKPENIKIKNGDSIAIIVLNHNNNNVIFKCLDSLIKYNSYNYEIIVVDNISTDGSLEIIEKKYRESVKIVKNSINGCSSGRNIGVKNTNAKYILFLDSDQGPTEKKWLDTFIYILKNFQKIGAVGWAGGYFLDDDFTGPTTDQYPNQALPDKYLFRTNIDYLGSGGMLICKKLFEKINGFDVKYDPYCFEDTDFSRKIIHHGMKIAYSKYLPVYHEAHSTTKSSNYNQRYLEQFQKNTQYFKSKWLNKL